MSQFFNSNLDLRQIQIQNSEFSAHGQMLCCRDILAGRPLSSMCARFDLKFELESDVAQVHTQSGHHSSMVGTSSEAGFHLGGRSIFSRH